MKVGIIGAGVAGLAAARELKANAAKPIVFERSPEIGGRVTTIELDGFVFDGGAQSVVPYQSELADVIVNQLDASDLVRIEKPVYVHEHLRVHPSDPKRSASPRYTYRTGLLQLPRLLAAGLDVRVGTVVTGIERRGDRFLVVDEEFDAVITTVPVPQASLLLHGAGGHRPSLQSKYRSCLSVLLGYDFAPPTDRYHALVTEEDSHPLQWLSLETVKSPNRSPEGCTALVAQLNPSYSNVAWEWSDERIVADVGGYLNTLFGASWMRPRLSRVIRWKYSQPEAIVLFDTVNKPKDRLLVAGDGVIGGRIEYAFSSGLRAARLLMDER